MFLKTDITIGVQTSEKKFNKKQIQKKINQKKGKKLPNFVSVRQKSSKEKKVKTMFSFHKPKVYRSPQGCCICKAKSSSSRFTDSKKYENDFKECFQLVEPRQGEICNACVLLVKRFKRLPLGNRRHWSHVSSHELVAYHLVSNISKSLIYGFIFIYSFKNKKWFLSLNISQIFLHISDEYFQFKTGCRCTYRTRNQINDQIQETQRRANVTSKWFRRICWPIK